MEPGQQKEAPYRAELKLIGGSLYIKLPPNTKITEYLDAERLKEDDEPNEMEVFMLAEDGPHGPYVSGWNRELQEGGD
jgi:hypothetical protein